jgi:hypothetical protein
MEDRTEIKQIFNKILSKNNGLKPNFTKFLDQKTIDFLDITYSLNVSLKEKLYFLYYDLEEPVRCKMCGSFVTFHGFTNGYQTYCSNQCSTNDRNYEQITKKCIKTNLKRHGRKYGFDYEKAKKTMNEKYGVDVPIQLLTFKQKIQQTNLKKYGNVCSVQGSNREKAKQIIKEKYDDKNFNNREKAKRTNLKRYGFEHNSQVPEIHRRMMVAYGKTQTLKEINSNLHYQTKPELKFIDYCKDNSINVWDGPTIRYYYHVDFETTYHIVEIKASHGWYKKDLKSGEINAKNEAASKYAKSINKEFLFLLDIEDYKKYFEWRTK